MAQAKRKSEPVPHEAIRALIRRLAEPNLPACIILRGEERYFADQAVQAALEAASAQGLEIVRFDSADPDGSISDLIGDLLGGALFARARLFLVRGADALLKKGASASAQAFPEAVLARVRSGDGSLVVLQGAGLRANHSLVQELTEAGAPNVACRKLWDSPPPWDPDPRKAELVQWLVGRARERKIGLSPDQAAFVVAATGNDLAALDGQLDRLGKGGGDLRSQILWEGAVSPFQLADPFLAGDAPRAVAGIESLFQSGFQGRDGARTLDQGALLALLFSALLSKLRETVAAGEVLERGGALDAAIEAAGVKATPTARKAFEARLAQRPAPEWRKLYLEVTELERRSRSGATVDVVDFVHLALRWRRKPQAPSHARR